MNLLQKTKEICKKYNIKPVRSKGQNFLINEGVYNKIIESAGLEKNDIVIEVGPGLGFLTEKLAKQAKKVIAVELDDKLAKLLEKRLKDQGIKNVEVVNENILRIRNQELGIKNHDYRVVANLPYNITSIFLRKFLSGENKPESMTLMLQKEVADRIVAGPGKMSLLAVSVQFYGEAKIIGYVQRNNFWPEPEVDSAIIQLRIRNYPPIRPSNLAGRRAGKLGITNINEKEFFRLVKIGFSAKRKMLKNNLANGFHINPSEALARIKSAGFSQNLRAQELSAEDWGKLLPYFEK